MGIRDLTDHRELYGPNLCRYSIDVMNALTQLTHATRSPSARAAVLLLIAYGVEVIGWRGLSVVNVEPPAGRTAI